MAHIRDNTAKKKFNMYVRLAALVHDIGKPKSKMGQGESATFYNHEIVGAKITFQILNRLKFSKKDVEKITKLVRFHLFYYNVDEVGEASVRRLVKNVGPENMEELLQVRQADRIGSGVPKAEPYIPSTSQPMTACPVISPPSQNRPDLSHESCFL